MDTNWKVVVDVALFSAVVAFYALSRVTVRTEERIQQRRRKKQSAVNIGGISFISLLNSFIVVFVDVVHSYFRHGYRWNFDQSYIF
jgi:hypothetical protein